MEDDAQCVPVAAADAAHAMLQIHAIGAASSLHRPVMHREGYCIALPSGTTSTRDCMRGRCSISTKSPPAKSCPGSRKQHRHLDGKYMFAIQVLVQAVVIGLDILEQQRRRTTLAASWQRFRNSAWLPDTAHRSAAFRSTDWRQVPAGIQVVLRHSTTAGRG